MGSPAVRFEVEAPDSKFTVEPPSKPPAADTSPAWWRGAKGFVKQAADAMLNPNFIQGGSVQVDEKQAAGDIRKYGRLGAILGNKDNAPASGWKMAEDAVKQMNPIAPAMNNPDTAEGVGQSAANLLMLRQTLKGSKMPVLGAKTYPAPAAATVQEAAVEPTITPLKGKTPQAQQADMFKQMGAAAPSSTAKPLTEIPGGKLEPRGDLTFYGAKSGESAALMQLTRYNINQLRAIALQRGLKVNLSEGHQSLINKIHDSLTDAEVSEFESAAAERQRFPQTTKVKGQPRPQVNPDVNPDLTEVLQKSIEAAQKR